jgi:hypothetical protein
MPPSRVLWQPSDLQPSVSERLHPPYPNNPFELRLQADVHISTLPNGVTIAAPHSPISCDFLHCFSGAFRRVLIAAQTASCMKFRFRRCSPDPSLNVFSRVQEPSVSGIGSVSSFMGHMFSIPNLL